MRVVWVLCDRLVVMVMVVFVLGEVIISSEIVRNLRFMCVFFGRVLCWVV